MSAQFIVYASIIGFFAGIIGYVGFDMSFFNALALWAVSGPAGLFVAFTLETMGLMPREELVDGATA